MGTPPLGVQSSDSWHADQVTIPLPSRVRAKPPRAAIPADHRTCPARGRSTLEGGGGTVRPRRAPEIARREGLAEADALRDSTDARPPSTGGSRRSPEIPAGASTGARRCDARVAPLGTRDYGAPFCRATAISWVVRQSDRQGPRDLVRSERQPEPSKVDQRHRTRETLPRHSRTRASPGLPRGVQRVAPGRSASTTLARRRSHRPATARPRQGTQRWEVENDPTFLGDGAGASTVSPGSGRRLAPGRSFPFRGRPAPAPGRAPVGPRPGGRRRVPPRSEANVRSALVRRGNGPGPTEESLRSLLPGSNGSLHRPRRGPHAGRARFSR
jgi:hypothetical protein